MKLQSLHSQKHQGPQQDRGANKNLTPLAENTISTLSILHLQRTIGNRAVIQLLNAHSIDIQRVIGSIPDTQKAAKTAGKNKRRIFSPVQKVCNELRKHMDDTEIEINDVLAKLKRANAGEVVDAEALTKKKHTLGSALDLARTRESRIDRENTAILGQVADAGVDETKSYFNRTWLPLIQRAISQVEEFSQREGDVADARTINDLDEGMPLLFQRLIRKKQLTLVAGTRDFGGANAGRAYYFNETKEWTLHVHKSGGGMAAHYKPVEDELSKGYHDRNEVSQATLIFLDVPYV